MNPGLVVKLRPNGPWRIGPDSGARNRVDAIYHSDSLYGAVTSALSRLGSLEAWLDATARSQTPAVSFSSCFPFIEDIGFVVPPRTIWPPTSPQAMSARVRWKSARFIPLSVVESILAGKRLNDSQWSVDGPSGCLVPAGKPGPFRTSVRWNAAVDRLSGASERHATACTEFREGCGLWTVVGFSDEAARDQWQEPVKAAFRLLADTGFGGERSRGWGRSETPEFVEGTLPGLIIEYRRKGAPAGTDAAVAETEPSTQPAPEEEAEDAISTLVEDAGGQATIAAEPTVEAESSEDPAPEVGGAEAELALPVTSTDIVVSSPESAPVVAMDEIAPAPPESVQTISQVAVTEPQAEPTQPSTINAVEDSASAEPVAEPALVAQVDSSTDVVLVPRETTSAGESTPEAEAEPAPPTEPALSDAPIAAVLRAADPTEALRIPPTPASATPLQAHWMLSLFTPAAGDAVDWGRGSYAVLTRGGRIDSPSGSGELKKQIQMVAEGSVLYADGVPLGAAPDVAPDGFAHPVFRAGFALAIPLPEVH